MSFTSTKVDSADFESWADNLSPYAYEDSAIDFLQEVEEAAPKFGIYTIRSGHYVAIIDPTWIKKFNSEFHPEKIKKISCIEAPQLLGGICLYFKSSFSQEIIKQSIKFSFLD